MKLSTEEYSLVTTLIHMHLVECNRIRMNPASSYFLLQKVDKDIGTCTTLYNKLKAEVKIISPAASDT